MTNIDASRPGHRPASRLRIVREPVFSGLDLAAFGVSLILVCMPLALGAFGL